MFCEVQPFDRIYSHLVLAVGQWNGTRYFMICNAQGRANGYCYDEHVYGKLILVED